MIKEKKVYTKKDFHYKNSSKHFFIKQQKKTFLKKKKFQE